MARKKRKTITMLVTVAVNSWMTPAQARREVRTLINEQTGYLSYGPDHEDVVTRAVRIEPAPGAYSITSPPIVRPRD